MVEQATSIPTKISFGVKRKDDSKLKTAVKTVVDVEVDSDEEREKEEAELAAKRRKLTHFEDGSLIGDEDAPKEVAVIPMVVEHDWRTQKLLEKQKEGTLTDEDKAKLALLVGSPSSEEESTDPGTAKIVVDGETEGAEDADYSAIPIESFGLAILRGCNWKDGEGIGKNPQKVELKLPARRPPGLGLGAKPKIDTMQKQNGKSANGKDEAVLEVKIGSFVKVIDGRSKGLYGKVEGRDDDTNSFIIRLAIGAKSVKVSQFSVAAVSAKEYEKDSKCLNKLDYDREKEKIEKQRSKYEEKGPSTSSSSNSKSSSSRNEGKEEELWVRSDLLVRFIDKEHKNGKLYNKKVRVVDVAGRKDVTIEDDRGNTYYNIRQSYLETVIPRNVGEQLMIVGGKQKGKLGRMVHKDKQKEKVSVELLALNETVTVYYEDVCAVKVHHDEDYE